MNSKWRLNSNLGRKSWQVDKDRVVEIECVLNLVNVGTKL